MTMRHYGPDYDPQVELEKLYLWDSDKLVYRCRYKDCVFEAQGVHPMTPEHPSSTGIATHQSTHYGPLAPDGLPWEGVGFNGC